MKKPLWIVVGLAVLVGGFIGYRQWQKHAAAVLRRSTTQPV